MMAGRSFADENLLEQVVASRYETVTSHEPIRFGAASFHADDRHLSGPASDRRLEPRVGQLLLCLSRRRGAVVSRETLLAEIWPGMVVGDDSLNRLIARLRRAFAEVGAGPDLVIETIPKSGYRLVDGSTNRYDLMPVAGVTRRLALAIAGAGGVGIAGLILSLTRSGSDGLQDRGRDAVAAMASAWESHDTVQFNGARTVLSERLAVEPNNRNLAGALAIASAEALLAYPRTEREGAALHTDLDRALLVARPRDREIARALLAWRGDDWAAIDRALVGAPSNKHTQVSRIRLLESVGRTREASELGRVLHQEKPTSLRRLAILLSLTLRHGTGTEAERLLAYALRYYDQHPLVWRGHFVSLALAGRFREAQAAFNSRSVAVAERALPPTALIAWELTLAALARPDAVARHRAIEAATAAPLEFQSATPESLLQLSLLQEESRQTALALAYYTGDEGMVRRARVPAHYPRLALNFGLLWDRALTPVRRAAVFADIAAATGLDRYWSRTGRFPDDRLAFSRTLR